MDCGTEGVLTEVVVPAEPATVACIHVHDDIGQVELFESVCDTFAVARGRVLACLQIGIGNEVGQRIGFDNQDDGSVWIFLEDCDNG